jgi:hypothetical protein
MRSSSENGECGAYFSTLPTLNKSQNLDMARDEYIQIHEPINFIGNLSLEKTFSLTVKGDHMFSSAVLLERAINR